MKTFVYDSFFQNLVKLSIAKIMEVSLKYLGETLPISISPKLETL